MKAYDELLAERDALLKELHKANSTIIDLQRIPPRFSEEYLAEIRAAAIEGFFAHFESESYWDKTVNDVIDEGYEYAAKVRQGGEK